MGGINSGRKSIAKESYKEEVVRLCWKYIKGRLADKNCPVNIKDDICKAICIKTAPQELSGKGHSDKVIIINQPKTTQSVESSAVAEAESIKVIAT